MKNKISYVVPVYLDNNSDILINLLKTYDQYPKKIKEAYEFIIVDDCSPIKIEIPNVNLSMTILRINTNIPWNVGGAKNLGIKHASYPYVLCTDLKFTYPELLLEHLKSRKIEKDRYYYIGQYHKASNRIRYFSHTVLTTKENLDKVGGFDEKFSGNYGYEDRDLLRSLKKAKLRPFNIGYNVCLKKGTDEFTEQEMKNYHSLKRDRTANRTLFETKKVHSGLYLNFEWSLIKTTKFNESKDTSMTTPRRYKNLSVKEMSKRMSVLVTNLCSGLCENCSQKGFRENYPPYHMSLEELHLFIIQCKKFGIKFEDMTITGGEPTLWKNFIEGIIMIKESNITNCLTLLTNGHLNAPLKIKEVLKYIDVVYVSYYSFNRSGYDELMKMNGQEGVCFMEAIDWHMKRPVSPVKNTIPAICRARFMTFVDGKVYHCPNCFPNLLELDIMNDHPECYCPITDNWIEYFEEIQEVSPRYNKDICGICQLNLNLLDYMNDIHGKVNFRDGS